MQQESNLDNINKEEPKKDPKTIYKKVFWTLIFAIAFILVGLIVPSKKVAILPGMISPVSDEIKVEGENSKSPFYTISVYVWERPPALVSTLLATSKNDVSRESKYDESLTKRDSYEMGQVSKNYSHSCSIINAYQEASKVDLSIKVEYEVESLIIYYRDKLMKDFSIGEVFTHLDGEKVTKDNYEALIKQSRTNSTFNLTKEDGTSKKLDYHQYVKNGVSKLYSKVVFLPNIKITKTIPKATVTPDKNVGGPSGGLLTSLSIYVSLLKLNIKDMKIAGTGTINLAGKVGMIGGAPQKVHTANKAKVDVFFMPIGNDSEVKNIRKKFDYHPVETFSDAVRILTENYLMK